MSGTARRGWRARRPSAAAVVVVALALARMVSPGRGETLIGQNRWYGIPQVVCYLVGEHFDPPPLYEEMLLRRATERLRTSHDAYDEAARACDRLDRYDEAIAWRAKGDPQFVVEYGGSREGQKYYQGPSRRHLIDDGHTWFRRWLNNGADRAQLDEVRTARDLLARAARDFPRDPYADHGNEPYVRKFLDWVLSAAPVVPGKDTTLPTFVDFSPGGDNPDEVVNQLIGWDLAPVDVLNALIRAFDAQGRRSMAYLAYLRCLEQVRAGKPSLVPGAPKGEALAAWIAPPRNLPRDTGRLDALFRRLRAEADALRKYNYAFMNKRLERGEFPGSEEWGGAFWKGYDEPCPPESLVEEVKAAEFDLPPAPREPDLWPPEALGELALLLIGLAFLFRIRRGLASRHGKGRVRAAQPQEGAGGPSPA